MTLIMLMAMQMGIQVDLWLGVIHIVILKKTRTDMKMIVNIDKDGMMGLLLEKEVMMQLVGQELLLVESMSDFRIKRIGIFAF